MQAGCSTVPPSSQHPVAVMDLVLASTSKYRRELLMRLGVPFHCRSPALDEEAWKDRGLPPRELAAQLARAKAHCVARDEPQAIIIGSDQVAACAGQILGKPGCRERAVDQLALLAGRTHELITAVCVWRHDRSWQHTDVTRLTMRPLTPGEIERYVAVDQPWDCAGAYKLEQRGIVLFESIESADHTAITGLPLMAVTSILREIGFAIP